MMGQSETLSSSYTLFGRCTLLFASHGNVRNYAEPKPFSGAKRAQVGFSSSDFTVQIHIPIPSTAGDVLRQPPNRLAYFSKVVSCYQCNNTPKTDLTSVMVPMGSTQNYAKFCAL